MPDSQDSREGLTQLLAKLPRMVRRRFDGGSSLRLVGGFRDLHVVVEWGGVAVMMGWGSSRPIMLDLLGPDASINGLHEEPLWDRDKLPREWELISLVPTAVLALPLDYYRAQVRGDPVLAMAAARAEARQHGLLLQRVAVLQLRDPVRRVAGMLALLAEQVGSACALAGGRYITLPQRLIAAAAHLSRQVTNRALMQLRARRLIDVERSFVCVLSLDRLRAVASGTRQPIVVGPPTECRMRHPKGELNCVPDGGLSRDG